jgi:CheY-like chemotaxis protein
MNLAHAAPGNHVAHFYEGEQFLARSMAAFFAEGARRGEPLIVMSSPRTLQMVVEHLNSGDYGPVGASAERIVFVDAEAALSHLMVDGIPDPARAAQAMSDVFMPARQACGDGTIWAAGDMTDVLCKQGNHAGAVRFEELWNGLSAAYQPIAVMCSFALQDFDDDEAARQLRAICRQHTHVVPAESFSDAADARASYEQVVFLQQRSRALGRTQAFGRPSRSLQTLNAAAPLTVYVIDDNASVRRSLTRLLGSAELPVRTFASAEAFLAEVDPSSRGCLIVDLQLVGMSGSELQRRLSHAQWSLPIIAMSGHDDPHAQMTALRQGARVFLRKPFDANALFDAVAKALARRADS